MTSNVEGAPTGRSGSTGSASPAFGDGNARGIGSHAYLREGLRSGASFAGAASSAGAGATRDLADAVHFLCQLHGRHPGVVEQAADAAGCEVSDGCDMSARWLRGVVPAFAAERLYVTRLAVAAGPVPSTPGSAISEAAVAGQRHAMDMLARSERRGCPMGAAVALVLDWRALRPLLDRAAARLGVEPTPCALPDARAVFAAVDEVATDPAVRRALNFGWSQVVAQHRGLFDLLEARQSARRDSQAG